MNALQTLTIVMEIVLTMLVVTHATVRSERSWIQMELLALVNEQNTSKSSYILMDSCIIDTNECANNNGGCDQTCNNTDGSYECQCNDGYYLDDDNHGCSGRP